MPPGFRPTSGAMKDNAGGRRERFGWALPISLVLHLAIPALLIFELPLSLPVPQEEQAVDVELVAPPAPPETAPEPPPPAEEPAEPPAPQPETSQPATSQPEAKGEDARPEATPVLRPVFEFGEKEAGPREALDGNSAEESAVEAPVEPLAQAEEQPAPAETSEAVEADQAAPPDVADIETAEIGTVSPETLRAEDTPLPAEQPEAAAPDSDVQVSLPARSEKPTPRPARSARTSPTPKLQEAKRLFSEAATGNQTATSATGNLPREVRGGVLCVSELREQLRNASPPYFPDLLPSYPLKDGAVLEVPDAAFRVRGQWFNLSFRCNVDADVTKVVSFALRVGEPIPPSQWARRGLPSQ